jgi:hypothetical protein
MQLSSTDNVRLLLLAHSSPLEYSCIPDNITWRSLAHYDACSAHQFSILLLIRFAATAHNVLDFWFRLFQ